ncbi:MAG: HEAT repeat domain-containing protein [bacterium]
MRRILVTLLVLTNVILLIGVIWLHARVGKKGRDIARLQEQVVYLAGHLPAGEGMERASESEERIRSLIEELGTHNLITQYQAGLKLKKIGEPAVPYLMEALKGSEGKDTRPLLLLLQGMGDADLTPELMGIYRSSQDAVSRVGIITILGKWGDYRAEDLIRAAAQEQDWRLRTAAAQALGNFEGDEAAASTLMQLLADKNRYVRSTAQNALRNLAVGEDGVDVLTGLLKQGDAATRCLLVRHLSKVAAKEARPVLEAAAKDTNEAVRKAAMEALASGQQ